MPFVNEKLTEEQRKEFLNREIKRPWSERIANPIYRTIDAKRNMCLWELGNLGRDYFDHYMFLFDWNGKEHFIIMEYIDPGSSHDYIMWSVSKFEKNVIFNKPFAEDFKEALIQYAVNGRPDQVVDFNIKVNLKDEN